ncbi:hypothetical protein O1611_g1651 [Lasiodiplodia mahajangana]|uniref:Uncharacterized protein n=1 Tax=Lasiodiplodia mahajangana TaxID=1108764 RepID=A0ACC2JX25_9PEZI|nr:hypothetical protein O1611_g1651 [Lasiodiplodia mahajangana]
MSTPSPIPTPPPKPPTLAASRRGSQVPAETQPSQPEAPPGTITIGIETEFLLRSLGEKSTKSQKIQDDGSMKAFASILAEAYNNSVPLPEPRMVNMLASGPIREHTVWKLVDDSSIKTEKQPWGIEMVSPIFFLMKDSPWRDSIKKTWEFLKGYYDVTANASCSTHVHTSVVGLYSMVQVKRLAQAIIHFEPAFEVLMPPERRGNKYAMSNFVDNVTFEFGQISRSDAINMLEKCGTRLEVVQMMSPNDSAKFGWNFLPVEKEGFGTAEFRRGAPSVSPGDVFRWVELATSFLRASIHMGSAAEIQGFKQTTEGLKDYLLKRGEGDWTHLEKFFDGVAKGAQEPIPVVVTEEQKKEQRLLLKQK